MRVERPDVFTAPSIDTATGTVYLKIVNVDPQPKEFRIALLGNGGAERTASYVYIRSDQLLARNQGSPDYSEQIAPVTTELRTVGDDVFLTVPGYSVGALVLRR